MKVLAPLLRYDYGDPRRGESLELAYFYPALKDHADVVPFWLEENGFPEDKESLQARLLRVAHAEKPDLIFFVLMKDEVEPTTIAELSRDYRTLNWFADDQWRFETFTRFIAPLLHWSVTMDPWALRKYRAIGCNKVLLSHWGSDFIPLSGGVGNFRYEVSFVGGRNLIRDWYVTELAKAGIHVSCFGAGWPQGRVSFEEMRIITRESKISLNLSNSAARFGDYARSLILDLIRAGFGFGSREQGYWQRLRGALRALRRHLAAEKNREQIKARNFEIPAWGGFQLSNSVPGLSSHFVPGKEIALFRGIHGLKRQIRRYLARDEEREGIRFRGNARASRYTYEKIIGEILEQVGK